MSTTGMISPTAISNMQRYSDLMGEQLRSTGMFQTRMVSLTSETENFGRSLERGNIRLGEYFRTATGYIKNQQTEIQKLAREQVRLQNSMTLATGDGRAMVITPTGIDEAIHKQQILNQEYRIFRQVVAGGSTQLINWGKNTQWAGRQLTVGLTVPLTLFGAAAAKTFMEADKQLTRLVKVYGDASKGIVDPGELAAIRSQTLGLAKDIASSMGVAAEETLGIAADIASTGKQGNELLTATNEAMRLSVLGEVDRQEAMRATLSIQSVFKKDTEGLTESINFLNAVENQTSTTLNDLVTGIVKAGPVVQGLGGDIEDLSLMMVAMREGGVPASEAANAIKSSLASLINPTKQTTATLNEFGVDLISIVDKNAGDVIGTLVDLQDALAGLDELSRQRAIEQIFGKFQFSRINALLSNLGKAGSQTQQVLQLAGLSAGELAENADRELKAVTESVTGRFQRALASVQANLIPIGETFTEVGTLILNVASKILEIFNNLPGPVQTFLKGLMYLVGLAGPIIMITGVFGNFLGYLLKGVSSFMALKKAGRGVFEYFTPESVAAKNASELITQSIYDETTAVNMLTAAIEKLSQALNQMTGEALEGGTALSGMQAGTAAAAEANNIIQSSYWRKPSGQRLEGGVFSHRFPKSEMEEETAGLVAGSGSLQPSGALGTRFDKINNAIGQRFVSVVAEGMSEESIQAIEELKAHINSRVRGGMTPQEEARVFQSKESYLAETSGQLIYPQVASKMLAANPDIDPQALVQYQQKFMSDLIENGPQVAISNLRETSRALGVDLDRELSATFDELNAVFDRTMKETGGNVKASMEAVSKAANDMEARAKAALKGVDLDFRTGAEVKRGDGISRGGTAVQLAMGEYYGLAGIGRVPPELAAANSSVIAAQKKLARAQENLTKSSAETTRLDAERARQLRPYIKDLSIQGDLLQRGNAIYGKVNGQWMQLNKDQSTNRVVSEKLRVLLERRANAELNLLKAQERLRIATERESIASQKAAEANLREAQASDRAAQADLLEAGSGAGLTAQGRGRGGRMAMMGGGALSALGMATMFLPTGEPGSTTEQASSVVGGVATGAGMGAMVGSVFPGIGTAVGAVVGGLMGGIGPILNTFSTNAENAAKAVEQLRLASESAAGKLGSAEQAFLGIDIKGLEDIPLEAFGEKTAEAQSQLNGFVEALTAAKDAEENSTEKTRIGQISQMSSAEQLINSSMFQGMIAQAAGAGASKDQIELMLEGYLDVSDKEFFADRVKEYLDSVIPDDATSEQISATFTSNLIDAANKVSSAASLELDTFLSEQRDYDTMRSGRQVMVGSNETDFMGVISGLQSGFTESASQALDAMMQRYNAGEITSQQFAQEVLAGSTYEGAGSEIASRLGDIKINGQSILEADPEFLMQILSALQNITSLTPDVSALSGEVQVFNDNTRAASESLISLLSNSDLESFGKKIDDIDFTNINTQSITELEAQLRALPGEGPKIADFFNKMIADGVTFDDALKALKLALSGTVTNLDYLADRAKNDIYFNIYYKQSIIGEGPTTGTYVPSGITAPMEMPGVSDLVSAATSSSGGGGGGGSSDTSAIEDAYDKQIEKQDKLIEKIKEERDERQKLLDLEKQAFDFSMKEQDLKNQIARARAEGRTAEAAMLQAQLDNARATNKEQETERARREREDRRIERAEKRKEELSRAKEIALEEARGDGGGGGGGGGMSDEEIKRIQARAEYLQEQLSKSIFKFSADIESAILDKGLAGFFDSKPVQQFRDEMLKLGVPVEQVNEYLDTVFDGFIQDTQLISTQEFKNVEDGLKKLGFEGERLTDIVGNAFAIMQDENLTDTEKIDLIKQAFYEAGMNAGEAEDAAKRFVSQLGISDSVINSWNSLATATGRAAFAQEVFDNAKADGVTLPSQLRRQLNEAGVVFASGGYVSGPGTSTSDSIPVRLSNGEYVVRASMVDKYGLPFLEAINKGVLPSMATGGMISRYPSVAARMAGGGYVYRGMAAGGLVNGTSAEYNINVNVETNASADDIANKVMQSLQRRDKMNRAGIRI
jgi:TP901 family phage tail tape measure protein